MSVLAIILSSSLVFLSFLILSNPLKANKKANVWLGIGFLLWASFWFDEISIPWGDGTLMLKSLVFVKVFQFMTSLMFYISVRFFTNPNARFIKKDALFLLAPIIYASLLVAQNMGVEGLQPVLLGCLLIHALVFTGWAYIKIRRHQKKVQQFASSPYDIDLKWLEYIIIGLVVIAGAVAGFNLIFYNVPLHDVIMGLILIFVYMVGYNALKQKEIYPLNEKHREEVIAIKIPEAKPSSKRSLMPDAELVLMKSRLKTLMESEQPYLDNAINLAGLAEKMAVSSHQLSYIINTGFNLNFFQFISKYRVEHAKDLLLDAASEKLTILGVAYESGFNSKTAFNTTFKKITGETPSEYKKKRLTL